jgi:hypothetical protein
MVVERRLRFARAPATLWRSAAEVKGFSITAPSPRVDEIIPASETGHEEHGNINSFLHHAFNNFEPANRLGFNIGQDNVDFLSPLIHDRQRLNWVTRFRNDVAVQPQRVRNEAEQNNFTVNNQNARHMNYPPQKPG